MEISTFQIFMWTFWYFKVPENYIQYLGLHRVNITPPPMFEDSLQVVKPTIWIKTRVHALYDYSDISELLNDTKNLRSSLQHNRVHMAPLMTSKWQQIWVYYVVLPNLAFWMLFWVKSTQSSMLMWPEYIRLRLCNIFKNYNEIRKHFYMMRFQPLLKPHV